MSIPLGPVVQAAVDRLTAASVKAGRGKTPEGVGWVGAPGQSAYVPYAIIWRIGGRDVVHRDLDGRFDEARPMLHVRTVGGDAAQADDLLDTVVGLLTSSPLEVDGATQVHVVYDSSITTTDDKDVNPAVFYTGAYLRFWLQEDPS